MTMEKIHTDKAPAAIGPYSQAIVHAGVLYTSGQIAINPETSEVEAKDIEGQTDMQEFRRCFKAGRNEL